MEEKLISLFSRFGYEVRKIGGKYSLFDRRIIRRIGEYRNLKELSDFAELMSLEFMENTMKRTIREFEKLFSPVTSQATQLEQVTWKGQEPEQEKKNPPAPEDLLFEKVCPTCGKNFYAVHKQVKYCCPEHYPSEMKKTGRNDSEVV